MIAALHLMRLFAFECYVSYTNNFIMHSHEEQKVHTFTTKYYAVFGFDQMWC